MIRQREFLGHNKRRLALLGTLAVLALALVLEHSGLGHGEMAEADMGEAISMCLAIVEVGAVMLGSLALLRTRPRFDALPRDFFAGALFALPATGAMAPPSRAGPSVLQVFRR